MHPDTPHDLRLTVSRLPLAASEGGPRLARVLLVSFIGLRVRTRNLPGNATPATSAAVAINGRIGSPALRLFNICDGTRPAASACPGQQASSDSLCIAPAMASSTGAAAAAIVAAVASDGPAPEQTAAAAVRPGEGQPLAAVRGPPRLKRRRPLAATEIWLLLQVKAQETSVSE